MRGIEVKLNKTQVPHTLVEAASGFWKDDLKSVYLSLASSVSGLSSDEARKRLKKYGHNVILEKDKRVWLDILVSQFASPLVLILVAALVISAFLGDVFDTVVILAVVVIAAFFGFLQEYKSEKVLSELKKYISYRTSVLRDGEKMQIDSRELVPGDIVFVGLGDVVPADVRIIETNGIAVDESVLTGESREVEKNAAASSGATPQEIKNGLFMGTTVVNGYAKAMVVATGPATFFGKTATIFSSKVPESDFQRGIRKFGDMLVKVILAITLVIFIANYVLGHGEKDPLVESALFALAIAVGMAPEALPAIITIALSNGSLMLAKKKVVTKKLAAIEDLGNMDILCTDKTGTLTEEIRVEKYIDLDEKDSSDVLEYAVLCNAAVGATKIRGNAVDVAIKKYALGRNLDVSRFTKIQEIGFDYARRRMGQVVVDGGRTILIVKGAPESVLSVCTKAHTESGTYEAPKKLAQIRRMIERYHLNGHTVIGVACRDIAHKQNYSKDDERDLTFIGFLLLHNPPKKSVKPTLDRLKQLNVRLKILTGDDPLITKELCSFIGFEIPEGRVIVGSELDGLSLSEMVEKFDVFARLTPEQKLAIIEALRKNGHVVGFLGDGINDAPSLRTADVGISVDTAAEVAKNASHIILLKKSLSVICDGVDEGRRVFGNVTKYILNTMSANQGNMITVALSSFFLPFIPLLPSQILLNNLLSDLPLVSIASDNVDEAYTRKPQKWDIKFIMNFMVFFGLISTFFDLLFIVGLYQFMHVDTATFRTAWFLESVLSEMFIVFSLRTHLPFLRNVPSRLLIVSSVLAGAVSTAVIYFPFTAATFHFVPLGLPLLSFTAAVLVLYFAATEIGKTVFFSKFVRAE